jgi:hypothetical protein
VVQVIQVEQGVEDQVHQVVLEQMVQLIQVVVEHLELIREVHRLLMVEQEVLV